MHGSAGREGRAGRQAVIAVKQAGVACRAGHIRQDVAGRQAGHM
jgi:hypothetical protein